MDTNKENENTATGPALTATAGSPSDGMDDRDIQVINGMVNALAGYCAATHGMIIRELTGWLWTEDEAAKLTSAND